jgi:hypothetical protein
MLKLPAPHTKRTRTNPHTNTQNTHKQHKLTANRGTNQQRRDQQVTILPGTAELIQGTSLFILCSLKGPVSSQSQIPGW